VKRKKVIVLGAGPAGLLAATAAEERGYHVDIYSAAGEDGQPKKSELYGCQYLHESVPDSLPISIPLPPQQVAYGLVGSSTGYREKVYGRDYTGIVSPDEYGPTEHHYAWDIRKVYDWLWGRWLDSIAPLSLSSAEMPNFLGTSARRIFATVPAPALCMNEEHKFPYARIWAFGEAPGRRSPIPVAPFTVVCNGDAGTGWYRAANVFGYTTVEWPAARKPPIDGVAPVFKPLMTDCDCWQTRNRRVVRLGRFGQWRKGVLVHQAYREAQEWL
jgi:hypothetical protein